MAINNKYTTEERNYASLIQQYKNKQRYHRKQWLYYDMKIIALKHLLNGKYGKTIKKPKK